jgi:hypothetical protein
VTQPSRRAPSILRVVVTIAATLAGVALLVWQLGEVGLDQIRGGLAAVGAGFLVVLILSFLRLWLRGLAWQALIPERVRSRTILAATIMGDTLGNLIPLNLLVSEPAKAVYLGSQLRPARGLASLTAENFFYTVSVAVYVTVGTAAMLVALDVPRDFQVAGVILLLLMAVILAVAGWLAWQTPALVSAMVARLPVGPLGRLADRIRDFETETYGSAGGGPRRLAALAACETTFHVLSYVEIWYTLWLVTGESRPIEALVFDTFNRVVNVVFKVVPLRIGVDEYTSETVAAAIGFPLATGVTLALVRKGRMLVWSVVGLALFVRRGLRAPDGRRSPSTS